MTQRIVITIDGEVDRTAALTGTPSMHECYAAKLKSMKLGDSFFVPDLMEGELNGLIRFAQDNLRVHLNAHHLDKDPIYRVAGLRVWRVAETDFIAPSATDQAYYLHIRSGMTYKVPCTTPQSTDPDVVRITYDEFIARPDYMGKHFKWADEDGTTWWLTPDDKPIAKAKDDQLVGEHRRLDHATFIAKQYSLGLVPGQNGNYIGVKSSEVVGDEPAAPATPPADDELNDGDGLSKQLTERGYFYHAESDSLCVFEAGETVSEPLAEPITRESFIARIAVGMVETYWRRADGTCVAVPFNKIEKALNTKGAVMIGRVEYGEYLASQNDDL